MGPDSFRIAATSSTSSTTRPGIPATSFQSDARLQIPGAQCRMLRLFSEVLKFLLIRKNHQIGANARVP